MQYHYNPSLTPSNPILIPLILLPVDPWSNDHTTRKPPGLTPSWNPSKSKCGNVLSHGRNPKSSKWLDYVSTIGAQHQHLIQLALKLGKPIFMSQYKPSPSIWTAYFSISRVFGLSLSYILLFNHVPKTYAGIEDCLTSISSYGGNILMI